METILQFKNLDYYYESNGKKVTILDNVNFSFQKRTFLYDFRYHLDLVKLQLLA